MDGFLIRGHDAVEIVALTRARVLYSNVALPGFSNGWIRGFEPVCGIHCVLINVQGKGAIGGIVGDDLCVVADAAHAAYLRSECGIIVFLRFLLLGRLGRRGISIGVGIGKRTAV